MSYTEYKKAVIKAYNTEDYQKLKKLRNEDITWYNDVIEEIAQDKTRRLNKPDLAEIID